MAKDDKNSGTIYILVAVLIIAVAIIVYLLSQKKSEDTPTVYDGVNGGDGDSISDDDEPDAVFHKAVTWQKTIKWDLGDERSVTMISGRYRVGGVFYTGVRMYIHVNGSWQRITMKGAEGGYPGEFIPFAVTVHSTLDAIKWEAEQGVSGWWGYPFSERYIDEVYAQVFTGPT